MKYGLSQTALHCCFVLSVCLMVGCTRSHSSSSQPEQPDLKKTVEWINQTYNPRPERLQDRGVYEKRVHQNGIYVTVNRYTTTLHLDGCVATLGEKQDPNLKESSEMVFTDTRTFNLGDIDPSRITVEKLASTYYGMGCVDEPDSQLPCDEAHISLPTSNEKRAIKVHHVAEFVKLTGSEHLSVSDSLDDYTYLYVSDLDYLPRLVTALKRGIELCGGKPSSF
jgi:hypothetical protein